MPFQGGLENYGGQATIAETSWWEARNATIGPDGRMVKRPGIRQWAQALKAPRVGGVGWQEIFSDLSHFALVDSGTTVSVTTSTGSALFETSSTSETAETASLERLAQPSDGTQESGESGLTDFRFTFRAQQALPAITNATQWHGFGGGFENDLGVSVGFVIMAAGIYVQSAGTLTLVSGTDIDDGQWHTVEMRQTSATSVSIIIDDGDPVVATYSDSALFDPGARQAIMGVRCNSNGLIHAEVGLMQIRSGNGKIDGVPISAIYDWDSTNPLTRHLLVVAGNTVYDDRNHAALLKPAFTTFSGDLTTFAPFQENLLIVNPRMPTRLWTGVLGTVPEQLPAATPAGAYLMTQHQGRPVLVRESRPLRVYVGGANTLEDWTTEDEVSATGESFFFDIPDANGERITNIVGDFTGSLIIQTVNSTYTLIGASIDTYTLRMISTRVGCVGPRAAARAGGDMLFLSKHGLHTLQTTQESSDLATKYLTAVLRNLWQRDSQFDLPKVVYNYRSSVVYAAQLGRTYVAVQTQEDPHCSRMYELNHDSNKWAGPWELDCEAVAFVLLGFPDYPTLVVGDTVGRVGTVNDDRKVDFETTAYTMKLRTARLDGRSLDPAMTRRTKIWRDARLYVLPRGGWDVDVSWTADGHRRQGSDSFNQNVYSEPLLTNTFILDQSSTADSEKVGVIPMRIDARGRWIEFTYEQSGEDEDLVPLGLEIDFNLAQEDRENA